MVSKIKNFFKNNFLAGILVLGPAVATFYLIKFLLGILDTFLPWWLDPQHYLDFKIPGLRIVLTLFIVILIGALGRYYIFKVLFRWGEDLLHKLPVVSGIYKAIKQLVGTFMGQGQGGFKNVVLVEFPRKGVYAIGFLTGVTEGETQEKTPERVLNVFIPTTPNPTSGFFVMFPEDQVKRLEMTVEQAFALIVSGGVVTPKSKLKV